MEAVDLIGLLVPLTYLVMLAIETRWPARTPRRLGCFVQRPESHCVHHRRGMHRWSCGDLPLWDMLIVRFRNPREFRGECGFDAPADRRLGALLAWSDVKAARYGSASRGVAPPAGPTIA